MKNYFEENKLRWNKLPGGRGRVKIERLVQSSDWWFKFRYRHFVKFWQRERGWEYEKYGALFKGRNVLEVGGGMGFDGITYARTANTYTYAELNMVQLQLIKRANALFGISNTRFEHMADIYHTFPQSYNAFYAHGVLHHVPFDTASAEFANINKYLEPGTVAVFLMYPRERWEQWGRPPFEKFGKYTDGGCPWAEWYDEEKICALTGPGYKLMHTERWGGKRKTEFINFEMVKL